MPKNHLRFALAGLFAILSVYSLGSSGDRRVRIEILYFDGCPSAQRAKSLVVAVARAKGVSTVVTMVDVPDGKAASRLRFLGSPTIRIDGRDIERSKRSVKGFGLACRLYDQPGGLKGLPPRSMVEAAIREALAARAKARR